MNNDTDVAFSKALDGDEEAAHSVTDKLRFSKGWRIQAAAPKTTKLLKKMHDEYTFDGCISDETFYAARVLIQMIEQNDITVVKDE